MRISILSVVLAFNFLQSFSQEITRDTVLHEVIIQAYNSERPIGEVAASVGVVDENVLNRFHNFSFVSSVNTVPGVRMEERSPVSYRLAIRGSSIRSPFGVRNVKIYFNGLPFTDAGGNTYLNLIDASLLTEMEIIKGPGGSLYGAGTGGVVLLQKLPAKNNSISTSADFGSYGSQRFTIGAELAKENVKGRFNYTHQVSDGYRDQSASQRDAFAGALNFRLGKSSVLSADIIYTDLSYETPGGLTFNEYNSSPSAARPLAEEKKAAVFNKTFFGGITYNLFLSENFDLTTSLVASITDFQNPSIREYEIRKENGIGVRSVARYVVPLDDHKMILTGGIEAQHLKSPIGKFENINGAKGNMQSDNDLAATSSLIFMQGEYELGSWILTAALSANSYQISFNDDAVDVHEDKNFKPALLPRVTLLKKLKPFAVYASFSRGFSPPTLGDLYPTGAQFNNDLDPEFGSNFELGIKGNTSKRFYYELAVYQFGLENTIVAREDELGDDYFTNAGKTNQLGAEVLSRWSIYENKNKLLSFLGVSMSYAYNHYRFKDYLKVDADLSGNKLTGVAPTVIYASIDSRIFDRVYLNCSYNYVDHTPLNDENTAYAKSYHLLGSRVGYQATLHKHKLEVYFGGDNLLNKKYSLGNDINTFGGRYYNAASPINFYGGVKFNFNFKND
jgi:iron complex outermembrane recepter protein